MNGLAHEVHRNDDVVDDRDPDLIDPPYWWHCPDCGFPDPSRLGVVGRLIDGICEVIRPIPAFVLGVLFGVIMVFMAFDLAQFLFMEELQKSYEAMLEPQR